VAGLTDLARARGGTAAQLALAWVMAESPQVVPIPGTKRRTHLEENLGALELQLSKAEIASLEAAFPIGAASGPRYPEAMMGSLGR
jgi:aryl-alcohol dehydrogenase-like predicted oxidoreductase